MPGGKLLTLKMPHPVCVLATEEAMNKEHGIDSSDSEVERNNGGNEIRTSGSTWPPKSSDSKQLDVDAVSPPANSRTRVASRA